MTNPKGAWFERMMADYLKRVIDWPFIDRQVKTGRNDKGDIAHVYIHGKQIVIECKNTARLDVATSLKEAEVERHNAEALAGVVFYKRTGKGKPQDQLVIMTAKDFASIVKGDRVE